MATLCITVTFLDGRFHGSKKDAPEWPPSPWRLFQALLASAAGNHVEMPDCFRFLEKLPPPTILAPQAIAGQARTAFVPNNQSDAQLDRQKLLTSKTFTPMLLRDAGSSVHYLWDHVSADQEEARQAMAYARMLNALGLGIDLVAGNGRMLSDAETAALKDEYSGECWVPAQFGGQSLRIPVGGSYDDLKQCHETTLNCWKGPIYTPPRKPTVFEEATYANVKQKCVSRHVAFFALLRPGDESQRMAAFDPRDAVHISAWVRHSLCGCSRAPGAGFDNPEEYVAGHVPQGVKDTPARFSYLPLPSIGHEHADGLVRRFAVAEPYGGDGRKAQWARRALQGALLEQNGRPVAELMYSGPDPQFTLYRNESRQFRTVTPVILPGFDDLDYAKAEKLFMKAVQQAGFPQEDVVGLRLQKAPFLRHAYHPREYKRARHFESYSAMHAEVTWRYPVRGPLALGVGRHRGLGLFAPVCRKE